MSLVWTVYVSFFQKGKNIGDLKKEQENAAYIIINSIVNLHNENYGHPNYLVDYLYGNK